MSPVRLHIAYGRIAIDSLLVAAMLAAGSGTVDWPRAQVALALMLVIRLATVAAVGRRSPELVRERAALPIHAEQSPLDRVLVLGVLGSGFLGLPLLAAIDVYRWHLSPTLPVAVSVVGLCAFALGWVLKGVALYTNAHAVSVARVQHERDHAVVDSGVYAYVRHPFYAADIAVHLGLALWLGSMVAAVAAVVPLGLMIARLRLEESMLCAALPGYQDYERRVPSRLIPRVW